MNKWQKIVGVIFGAIAILFLVGCYLLMFHPQLFMGADPEDTDKATGLHGNVSDLFFVDKNTGIALSSFGIYDKQPSNKGIAVIDNHIYGFIFDKDSCTSRLYDFKNKNFVGNFSIPGDVSMIKTTDSSCVILAAKDQRNLVTYDFEAINNTLTSKATYEYKIMQPLKFENELVYTLVNDRPNADNYLLTTDKSGQTKATINLNRSNIKVYCLTDRMFYCYDQFRHEIVRFYISETI